MPLWKPLHWGLFFTPTHTGNAQRDRAHEPLSSAWAALGERPPGLVEELQMMAMRSRFEMNDADGKIAVHGLQQALTQPLDLSSLYFDQLGEMMVLAQTFEMVRDHGAWNGNPQDSHAAWLDAYSARLRALETDSRHDSYAGDLWHIALRMAEGILREDEAQFMAQVAQFHRIIAEDVRPQGFIAKVVEGKNGGSMMRTVLCASALVLMAEMASHAGVDLWTYEVRGVSVLTAALYPIYYYYTTAKWKWDADIAPETVQALFAHYGGYLEMVYHRTSHRDVKTLLDALRPLNTPYAGGLTTLTHGTVERKRRGLLG